MLAFSFFADIIGRVSRRIMARKDKSSEMEATYVPAWVQWLKSLLDMLSIAGKILFIVFLFAFLAFIGYGISDFDWSIVLSNMRSLLIWTFPHGSGGEIFWGLGGLSLSIILASIALTTSFAIGLVAGLGRLSENPLISTPSVLYIELVRGNPLIMVIFWVYFFSPIITGMQIDVFWSASIAFIIFSGAYIAEIVRAGVRAIPSGQMEAAMASGLNYFKSMRLVILPQALKIMIPAIVGQFIALFKDTSLAYIIGVFELTTVAQTINNRLMIYPFEIYTTIAILYFVCCYAMSMVARKLERKYTPEARFDVLPDMA
jgi:polar amino acid transport system permease protein